MRVESFAASYPQHLSLLVIDDIRHSVVGSVVLLAVSGAVIIDFFKSSPLNTSGDGSISDIYLFRH
jgi:hypothetical protein